MAITRDNPRISLNALARYLVATPAQRRTIIREQKHPPTYKVIWYEFATNAIRAFVLGGMVDEAGLLKEIDRLYATEPTNANEEVRLRTNAEAIEAFLDCCDQLDFSNSRVASGEGNPPKLILAGVEVSVRPEFIIESESRGRRTTGALKLYISKDSPLTEKSAPLVAGVVSRYVAEHLESVDAAMRSRDCQVLDVFGRRLHFAPAAMLRRLREIEAACEEIALWWPAV